MLISIMMDHVSGTLGTCKKREGNSALGSFQFKTGYNRRMQTLIRQSQDNSKTRVIKIICSASACLRTNIVQVYVSAVVSGFKK